MSVTSGWAAGLLLVIAGVWLLLQTLVGNLPSRILGASFASGSSSGATPSTSPDSPQGNLSVQPPPNPGSTATPGTQPSGGYAPYVPPATGPLQGSPGAGTTQLNPNNPKSPPAPT